MTEETKQDVEEKEVTTPTQDPSEEGSQGEPSGKEGVEKERKPINLNELDEFRQYQASMDRKLTEKEQQLKELRNTVEAMKAGKEYDTSRYEELARKIEQQEAVEQAKQSMKRSWGHLPDFDTGIFAEAGSVEEVNAAAYNWLNERLAKEEGKKVDTEERKKKAETGVDETPPSDTTEPEDVEEKLAERMQAWRKVARQTPVERGGRNPLNEFLMETDPKLRREPKEKGKSSKV